MSISMWTVKVEGVEYQGFGGSWYRGGAAVPPREWPALTARLLAERQRLEASCQRELMSLSAFLLELGETRAALVMLESRYARRRDPAVGARLERARRLTHDVFAALASPVARAAPRPRAPVG
jgi:hypothetical protein